MSNALIVVMDLVAAVFFGLAVLWAYHNYQGEIALTEFWIGYAVAAAFGGLFMTLRALEWAGIRPELMDTIQPFVAAVGITLLMQEAIICALSPIKRQVR